LDLVHFIRQHTAQYWNLQWQNLRPHNELVQLKKLPTVWTFSDAKTRRQEIFLTRLRIGQTRITLSHLVSHVFPAHATPATIMNP